MDLFKNIANVIGGKKQATPARPQSRPRQQPVPDSGAPIRKEYNTANLLLHRSLLPDIKMKKTYDMILAGLESWEESIQLSGVSADELSKLYTGVLMDNPHLFHVGKSFNFLRTMSKTTVKPTYIIERSQVKSVRNQLDAIVNKLRMNATGNKFDDERLVHDYVARTTVYPESNLEYDRYHSLLGALIDHKAVCEGISKATAFLMNELGISCCVISGSLKSTAGPHGWNVVRISGNNYHLDVTNDSLNGKIEYNFFNLSDRQMSMTHVWDIATNCIDESKRFIGDNGHLVKDLAELESLLHSRLKKGETTLTFVFDSEHDHTVEDIMPIVKRVMRNLGKNGSIQISSRGNNFTITLDR